MMTPLIVIMLHVPPLLHYSFSLRAIIARNDVLPELVASRDTRGTDPTLDQCWTSVGDAGPTLIQHRIDFGSVYRVCLALLVPELISGGVTLK